jgi:hypothetical protein
VQNEAINYNYKKVASAFIVLVKHIFASMKQDGMLSIDISNKELKTKGGITSLNVSKSFHTRCL